MIDQFFKLVAAVAAISVLASSSHAQDAPLSAEKIKTAIEIESQRSQAFAGPAQGSAASKKLAETKAGRARKSVVVSVRPIGSQSTRQRTALTASASSKTRAERALVTRFDYATGRTVETTVDLDNGEVLAVRPQRIGYPTPLANEEKETAKRILVESQPEIANFVQEFSEAVFSFFPSSARRATDPLYGHRLVLIWAHAKPNSSRGTGQYLVDLSNEELVADR